MTESIFTKIINGDIPSYKIYEDEYVYAFLDIYPVSPGHTLVVPKKQVEFLWDVEENLYQKLMITSREIARHLRDRMEVSYVGVKVIGVDVPHAHIHLIPFNSVEEYNKTPLTSSDPDHTALATIAMRLNS